MWPMAEYAYNNSLHSAVEMTPFFGSLDDYPWPNRLTVEFLRNPTSWNYIEWITSVYQVWNQGLETASKTKRKYQDKQARPVPV